MQVKTYLGPKCQITDLDPEPRDTGNGHSGPYVGEVERVPETASIQHDDGMDVSQYGVPGKLLTEQPKDKDNGNTNGEAGKSGSIGAVGPPQPSGANSAPENGGGEEGICIRASKGVGGAGRGADVVEIYLKLQDGNAYDGGEECGNHLGAEDDARRNLEIVGNLEVGTEVQGVRAGDVAKRLEVAHGQGVSLDPGTAYELGQNVERHLYAGHGEDNARGHNKDEGQCDPEEDDARRGVRWVVSQGDTSEYYAHGQD